MAYDNTNTGAAFKPFDSMKMILQGKVNLEGNDHKTVLVADTTKSGMKIIEVYQKVGVMFENDNGRSRSQQGNADCRLEKRKGWEQLPIYADQPQARRWQPSAECSRCNR